MTVWESSRSFKSVNRYPLLLTDLKSKIYQLFAFKVFALIEI